jgi:hypothetical protein
MMVATGENEDGGDVAVMVELASSPVANDDEERSRQRDQTQTRPFDTIRPGCLAMLCFRFACRGMGRCLFTRAET